MPAAVRFYNGLFGWQAGSPAGLGGEYVMFSLNGRVVAGLGPQMNPGPAWWTTYLTVIDADATVAAARAAGASALLEPMDVLDKGRMAVLHDAVGAVISIWQPRTHHGAEVTDEPGTPCWFELACRDTAKAKAFYETVFGWHGRTQRTASGSYTVFALEGRDVAGMLQMDKAWPPEIPSHWMIYFQVTDCDASASRCLELGGAVAVAPSANASGRFAVLNDPQGALFAVIALQGQR